ncbi:MAG TPA: hypothetical protein PLP19_00765 [bacterium]|nr:hypothetical protein [bacterium]HPN41996.1 hypothetical protein [bacterium]
MLFFVKVRIDINKMPEMGRKLVSGELDKSCLKSTFCIQNDPSVGLNIWEAASREEFERVFAPHRQFYAEVMEITPVIPPAQAQELLIKQLAG